jgi:hypothetical protein
MGNLIYSVSPLQAFRESFGIVAFLFALGVLGVGMGILRRRDKVFARFVMGILGILLFVVSATLAFITIRSITGGAQTFSAQLNDKQIANDNCGDSSTPSTCARYILETRADSTLYDLDVTKETYEKAQINSCYSVTYYPSQGLFGRPAYLNGYQSVSNITQIESVACK